MKNLKLLSKPIRILYDRFVKNNPNALAIALVEELIKENLKLKQQLELKDLLLKNTMKNLLKTVD